MKRAAAEAGHELRVGLDVCEPLPEGEDLYGTPVIVASRVCDSAAGGEILASEVVCRVAGPASPSRSSPPARCGYAASPNEWLAGQVAWRGEGETAPESAVVLRQIRVVVADDQRLVRSGFRVILDDEPDIQVVGEAADGRSAVDIVRRTRARPAADEVPRPWPS